MAKIQLGRYGENPHQTAWAEKDESYKGPTVLTDPLHGKQLGYNNLQDANAALETILDFRLKPAVVIMKHKNPCGLATGDNLKEAFINAWYGDEVSAFGSIIGFSQRVDLDAVKQLSQKFVEVIVAPSYDQKAIDWIKSQEGKKDLRVIAIGDFANVPEFTEEHKIRGGTLSQTQDNKLYLCGHITQLLNPAFRLTEMKIEPNSGLEYKVGTVTDKTFKDEMLGLIEFSIIAGKHTHSNAIILAYEYEQGKYRVLGMGAGQPNRKDSGEKLSLPKAQENLMRQYFKEKGIDYPMVMDRMIRNGEYGINIIERIKKYSNDIISSDKVVLYSDAFFPFRDGLDAAAELGVKYIVQPGGSKGDDQVIKAANEHGVAMIFTGIRHFKH